MTRTHSFCFFVCFILGVYVCVYFVLFLGVYGLDPAGCGNVRDEF